MKKGIGLGLAAGLFLLVWLFGSLGCKPPAGAGAYLPQSDKEYILIFNCVDELLTGDLTDTVSLNDLASQYSGKDIVGLGTTSRQHGGELLFLSGKCYWADPTSDGKITEIDWTAEKLPFCAITRVSDKDALVFPGITGNIHDWLVNKLVELDIPLAAIRVNGTLVNVDLSIADKLPTSPSENLKSTLTTISQEQDWQMAGFYALNSDDQAIITVPESPVHLHGKTLDNSHGGHVKKADSISSTVTIYPIKQFILSNRVPASAPAESEK
ncbi:MAG: acetolactate decarboxylase [Dehalococcoidia bacterium]|nr:acetolactate decarboxylase [Dehalococcoidia bacterium]